MLSQFSSMVAKPGKTPEETRRLVTELEQRMKAVEELTGKEVDEDVHAKSILIGILDPVTRQHTAMNHGKNFKDLKRHILEFINNVSGGSSAMQIGRL